MRTVPQSLFFWITAASLTASSSVSWDEADGAAHNPSRRLMSCVAVEQGLPHHNILTASEFRSILITSRLANISVISHHLLSTT